MGKSLAQKEGRKARESRLQLAIANDNVDELHKLIGEEPQLLDRLSKDPFPNTPLHIAAAAGKTGVAVELAILKPSCARKLNPEGYSPLHLALQHQHYHTARALETFDPKLIRVRGRFGITPLHYIAEKEDDNELELLAEFLFDCRSSIKDLTSRYETAVHVAIKSHNLKAFKILFGWLKRVNLTEILDWKDQDGNTVLHIAVLEKQPKIINLLIGYANVNAKNFQDKTALDIFGENLCGYPDVAERFHRQRQRTLAKYFTRTFSLSEFFSRELTAFEKCASFFRVQDESARDIILVVSTLIASATYQAALSPPGGYWSDSSSNPAGNSTVVSVNSGSVVPKNPHPPGSLILDGWKLFWYVICNSTAFFASITSIIAIITFTLEAGASIMVYISIPVLCAAYFITFTIQMRKHNGAAGISLWILFELFVLSGLVVSLFMRIKHRGVRLDGIRRSCRHFPGSKY